MKATEQYFPVVLFIMLYKVVLTFESVDKILKCAIQMKATEQYFTLVLVLCCAKSVVLTFTSVDWNLKGDPIRMKANKRHVLLLILNRFRVEINIFGTAC